MNSVGISSSHGRSDGRDWLLEAEEPLASLQLRSGGELPGPIVAPALLELVRKSRSYGLKLARNVRAHLDDETVQAWVEVRPDRTGEGCVIGISGWQASSLPRADAQLDHARRISIARDLADFTARLGPNQEILTFDTSAPDLEKFADRLNANLGAPWTKFVAMEGNMQVRPLHWRLLDEAQVVVDGSERSWTAHIRPLGMPERPSRGFELYLVADTPLPDAEEKPEPAPTRSGRPFNTAIGREIAPVLRQPIARIIANAETIRTQLAGPLAEEYSNYAADIASAGEHLLALIDDLSDLEVVEDEQFSTAPDQIDLADLARRATGILGVRAKERGIDIHAPTPDERAPAVGEFRRVLQILLNLIGNAIRYSPDEGQIWLRVGHDRKRAWIVVADQGEGLDEEQQARIFEKFERLGRSGDGGSGLGLYISRRLARAMRGDLNVESEAGQGARFTLDLPADTSG